MNQQQSTLVMLITSNGISVLELLNIVLVPMENERDNGALVACVEWIKSVKN
jgi:hypothetical protein